MSNWFTEADVEAAARAGCETAGLNSPGYTWDHASTERQDAWRIIARAALSAIPDPRAARYAEGFDACKAKVDARLREFAFSAIVRKPSEATGHALNAAADAIADLKPEGPKGERNRASAAAETEAKEGGDGG